MRKLMYFSIFISLIFVLSLTSASDAHAINGNIVDAASCEAIGGSWTNPNTCTVTSLTIDTLESVTIGPGIVLVNDGTININNSNIGIINFGTINNLGTININSGVINNNSGGTINNSHIITNNFGTIYNNSGGTINNNSVGTISNTGGIFNFGGGTITNSGTLTNNFGGAITNFGGATIYNSGIITNLGTITNIGTINNLCGGIINNSGTISGNPVTNACVDNSATTVTPNPSAMPIVTSMTFHVKVVDSSTGTKTLPTGTVSWSDGGAGGTFSSSSCTLTPLTSISTCAIVYTSSSKSGPVTITATYSGDGTHNPSSGKSALTVTLRSTVSTVTPNPASTTVGTKIVFHLKVIDSSPGTKTLPTGTATWSDGGAGGTFGSSSCTLTPFTSISTCAIAYTSPSKAGPVTITATYSGDGSHKTSSGTSALTVS